jgi:hypothetical protein
VLAVVSEPGQDMPNNTQKDLHVENKWSLEGWELQPRHTSTNCQHSTAPTPHASPLCTHLQT